MFVYRIATAEDLERIWEQNVRDNPDDPRWVLWKEKYIRYNLEGKGVTFVAVCDGIPVGEGTLLLSETCDAVKGKAGLADGKRIANVNALRIQKPFEGRGHISALMRLMEAYAKEYGIHTLTIGVEAKETRNLAIYLHWGFQQFILDEKEDGELILYFKKEI